MTIDTADVVLKAYCPALGVPKRGKVRDIYDLGDSLLIVATDRISAFDVVMPDPVPDKGPTLTRISEFWLKHLGGVIDNHLISTDVFAFPEVCWQYVGQLAGRSMRVKKAKVLPAECIVRGYLVGSGWEDYRNTGSVCGINLPKGLVEAQKLSEPLFTPSTKAGPGQHDENIPFTALAHLIGRSLAEHLRDVSLTLYAQAAEYAAKRGIILADTKFEFGLDDNDELLLIDEVLTPDSSRFWPADRYSPGSSPESFDKQFLRNYLKSSGWKKTDPPPHLPEEIVSSTRSRYLEAEYRLIDMN